MTTPISKRPAVVTFVGVLVWIQASVAAVSAVVAFWLRSDPDFQDRVGQSTDALVGFAIAEVFIAILLMVVASGLMSGTRSARAFVAVVMGLRVALAAWTMVTHHTGGLVVGAGMTILIAVLVLWALYGHAESEAYFGG
jgi:hypothetical protein